MKLIPFGRAFACCPIFVNMYVVSPYKINPKLVKRTARAQSNKTINTIDLKYTQQHQQKRQSGAVQKSFLLPSHRDMHTFSPSWTQRASGGSGVTGVVAHRSDDTGFPIWSATDNVNRWNFEHWPWGIRLFFQNSSSKLLAFRIKCYFPHKIATHEGKELAQSTSVRRNVNISRSSPLGDRRAEST